MTFEWPRTAIEIAAVIVVMLVVRTILVHLITRWLASATKRADARAEELRERTDDSPSTTMLISAARESHRTKTLGHLLRSVVNVTTLTIAALTILQLLGVRVGPLLASAGIGGIIIGLGAQSLVKDVLAGVFLISEDQFGVGDFITVNDISGVVRNVGLRVTRLQDSSGQIWYVRNGEIITLGNQTQGWSSNMVSFPVARTESPDKVIAVLNEVCQTMARESPTSFTWLDRPKVLGVDAVDDTAARYGVVIKCPGNQQWEAQRELRRRVLQRFQDEGISAPPSRHQD